ncbi:MAG: hypothetical protein U9O78_04850 [Patescibacteria group bacterium]|nr:hypothetical protein [Patescibacteria group bacterium]
MSKQRSADDKKGFQGIGSLFDDYQIKEDKGYITKEFQDYGYRLALKLDDLRHKGLYIKMAKEEDRALLEQTLRFVIDSSAKSKARLFMWKLKKLKDEKQNQ